MSKEAIEHYEAALKEAFPSGATGDVFHHWNEARKALAEQPAQQQEPFIYYRHYDGGTQDYPDEKTIPLYTSPPASKTEQQEPVAKVCHDLDGHIGWNPNLRQLPDEGAALYTSPPAQRKPLTGEEMNQIEARWDASMHGSKIAFVVRETEAAHGIKGDA